MSAEGISGRKPYGLRTRMIECRGWKRLEANRTFEFQQVSKKDFNAIFSEIVDLSYSGPL